MQVLFFIMAFTNAVAITFFALRYIARTLNEKKAQQSHSHSHLEELQLSL